MIAPFHIGIALLGFPPTMFFTVFTLHTLWQFWPHTRAIGPSPIDGILNSPANHRVHHAINPEYIDKNYSGFLILWDRLFGTFTPERAEPAYGTVKPLGSFNPVWANLAYWTEMLELSRRCPDLLDRLSVPFRPPEWRPASLGGLVSIPPASRQTQARYTAHPPRVLGAYAVFAFAVVALASPALANAPPGLPWLHKLIAAVLVIASLASVAGLVENRPWARPLEAVRLACLVPFAGLLARGSDRQSLALVGAGVLVVGHAVWLIWALRTAAISGSHKRAGST
jgi:hypothetical protein